MSQTWGPLALGVGPSRPCCAVACGLFAACLGWGCRPSPPESSALEEPVGAPWFEDVTAAVGLDFVHDAGPTGTYFMPQVFGAGAAFFDYDGDGRLDILLLQSGGPGASTTNRLYHAETDGRFTDVSKGSGLDYAGYCTGVAVGDVNNDGRPDVLITEYGGLKLFLNNGDGTFTDVTEQAGLHSLLWGTSASFLDFDRDGWLDLVVANYVAYDPGKLCRLPSGQRDFCHPSMFPSSVTHLYRNLGRTGGVRFEDVTDRAGLDKLPGPALGVVCADFDGDGWPDLFVANDGQPNRLWINRHDGTFTEEAVQRGLAYNHVGQAEANMGIALGDVNGDGLFDVFVTHLTDETHTLWVQGPAGVFRDATPSSGVAALAARGTGFGTVLADLDNDGALDLAVVHGRVARARPEADPELGPFWAGYAERNRLFRGDGTGRFRDLSLSNLALCGRAGVARGLACGDVDTDGGLDLLVTTVGGRARLYRNVAPERGHWLQVRALDPVLRRDAYGAEVTVRAGDRRWWRLVNPGYSFQCSNDPRAHFGLGGANHVEAIEVRWPDGTAETFPGREVDQSVVLCKGKGRPAGR